MSSLCIKKLLLDVANNKKNVLGFDQYGNSWRASISSNGEEIWTQSLNGKIFNGGINPTPNTYNPRTELSNEATPGQ